MTLGIVVLPEVLHKQKENKMYSSDRVPTQATVILNHPITGAQVHLLGVGHTSMFSAMHAQDMVQTLKPEVVVLEIDEVNIL